jgi:hypothetical protein
VSGQVSVLPRLRIRRRLKPPSDAFLWMVLSLAWLGRGAWNIAHGQSVIGFLELGIWGFNYMIFWRLWKAGAQAPFPLNRRRWFWFNAAGLVLVWAL